MISIYMGKTATLLGLKISRIYAETFAHNRKRKITREYTVVQNDTIEMQSEQTCSYL